MDIFGVIVIAISLAMDAFAVSICKGASTKNINYKNNLTAGLYFGIFQLAMPLIGYYLIILFKQSNHIANVINEYDHWIGFFLLIIIGINMIKESFSNETVDDDFSFKTMILLSVATSIDALSVGITFATVELTLHISLVVLIIGIITFILSFIGISIGNIFGSKFKKISEISGGIILILIALRILLTGLNIIS